MNWRMNNKKIHFESLRRNSTQIPIAAQFHETNRNNSIISAITTITTTAKIYSKSKWWNWSESD